MTRPDAQETPGLDPRRITPASVGAPVKDDGVKVPQPRTLGAPQGLAADPKAIWTAEEVADPPTVRLTSPSSNLRSLQSADSPWTVADPACDR